jgi:ATP-dependent Clp protease ATP-binding subunit ClpA
MGLFSTPKPVSKKLDESVIPPEVKKLEEALLARVAGQDRAVKQFVRVHEIFLSGMQPADRPLQVLLFVGPTGSGKTHVAEVFSELQNVTLIKIDCGEFQHSHEVSKLLGAPPGYVGQEVQPKITKNLIESKWKGDAPKYTVILFDEIEKAHNALHQILLGMSDRGAITTGKNETIDLKNCIIVMTSNLGSGEVKKLLKTHGGFGFSSGNQSADEALDEDIYRASKQAVTKFFSPEFFNRIDRMIVFRSLNEETLRQILDIELKRVQDRVLMANKFVGVEVSARGKEFLVKEGTSKEFGARELRRTIERFLISKLTRAFATNQAINGDIILADKEIESDGLVLEILKEAIVMPKKEDHIDLITVQPKKVFVEPENPKSRTSYEGIRNPGYCARCGFRWYEKHVCFDLLDDPIDKFKRGSGRGLRDYFLD